MKPTTETIRTVKRNERNYDGTNNGPADRNFHSFSKLSFTEALGFDAVTALLRMDRPDIGGYFLVHNRIQLFVNCVVMNWLPCHGY